MTYRLPRAVSTEHGREQVEDHGDLGEVLAAVRKTAADLLAKSPVPPSTLNVRAGAVAVEMGWATATPGAAPVTAAAPVAVPVEPVGETLKAATVGVFYSSPSPGSPPFVAEGDEISTGQQIAIIEAMKLMLPVEADKAGRVAEVLVEDGDAVEFGQPLIRLAAEDETVDQAA